MKKVLKSQESQLEKYSTPVVSPTKTVPKSQEPQFDSVNDFLYFQDKFNHRRKCALSLTISVNSEAFENTKMGSMQHVASPIKDECIDGVTLKREEIIGSNRAINDAYYYLEFELR